MDKAALKELCRHAEISLAVAMASFQAVADNYQIDEDHAQSVRDPMNQAVEILRAVREDKQS